jgi:hypothetical protein
MDRPLQWIREWHAAYYDVWACVVHIHTTLESYHFRSLSMEEVAATPLTFDSSTRSLGFARGDWQSCHVSANTTEPFQEIREY